MIALAQYKGKKLAVFGLGKAGQATVSGLLAGGARVFAWDDNEHSRAAVTQRSDNLLLVAPKRWRWEELAGVVISPGIPLTHPDPHPVVNAAKQNHCPIIGDIELLYQAQPAARYIGITGTNGKSTTTTLIGHILKHAGKKVEVGGNLGTPALSLAPLQSDGGYVLEASSFQLDLISTTRFNIAVLLNIAPDHLDRHGDMEGYVAAKMHLFDRQTSSDAAVIAVDDDYTRRIYSELKKRGMVRVVPVSAQTTLDEGVYVKNGVLHDVMNGVPHATFDIASIQTLTGEHNWQNAATAYTTARLYGIGAEEIEAAMRSFSGLRHRLQLVAEIHGVKFINDSKATNADATSHALKPYRNIYWLAGGKPKEGGIESLKLYFSRIAHAFLMGQAEDAFAATLEGQVPYTRCGALMNAVKSAASMAFAERKPDSVVLLSPACASFDQWKNFEERGDAFCEIVRKIEATESSAKARSAT